MDNKIFDFSKREIIEETGMSKTTFYKHWDEIVEFGIVKENRKFGRTTLYTLNRESPIVQELMEVEQKLIEKIGNKNKIKAVA